MIIEEEQRDLFTAPQGFYLVNCISSDFLLEAGIARQFDKVYDMRLKLEHECDCFEAMGAGLARKIGTAIVIDNVFNLVIKNKSWDHPTYGTLASALVDMREIMEDKNITKLAIPKLCCGSNRLDWCHVFDVIATIFEETNVEILICEW